VRRRAAHAGLEQRPVVGSELLPAQANARQELCRSWEGGGVGWWREMVRVERWVVWWQQVAWGEHTPAKRHSERAWRQDSVSSKKRKAGHSVARYTCHSARAVHVHVEQCVVSLTLAPYRSIAQYGEGADETGSHAPAP